MITTEKQHTERSSQLPIEDVFTCHDINPNLAYIKTQDITLIFLKNGQWLIPQIK